MPTNSKDKEKDFCKDESPINYHIACQKKRGHAGKHCWKGYHGVFEQKKLEVYWENE